MNYETRFYGDDRALKCGQLYSRFNHHIFFVLSAACVLHDRVYNLTNLFGIGLIKNTTALINRAIQYSEKYINFYISKNKNRFRAIPTFS